MDIYIHADHSDMKGQMGGCVKTDTGMLHAWSSKQKLNTKSSTESKFVGVSDYLPYAIWLLYFLEDQGYNVSKKVLHQDNQSTIKILKNGKKSAGTRSWHIETRFF